MFIAPSVSEILAMACGDKYRASSDPTGGYSVCSSGTVPWNSAGSLARLPDLAFLPSAYVISLYSAWSWLSLVGKWNDSRTVCLGGRLMWYCCLPVKS